jgi:hypothetical protein
MARKITDYNGTVVAVGGAYPYGDIKDNPSGTIIDRKSNADLQQFFQKLADSAGITLNSLADNSTNGFQLTEALSKVIGNHAAQIVVGLLGVTYDPTKVYILWGCANRAISGFALYDGELYYIQGNAGFPCGGGLVDIVTVFSPVLYTNGVQTLQIACGTSGTGIANFADLVYVNKWKPAASLFSWGAGGSGTIDPADVATDEYQLIGDVLHYRLTIGGATVTSAPTYLEVQPTSMLLAGIGTNEGWSQAAVYIDGTTRQACFLQGPSGVNNLMRIYPSSGAFSAGVDNQEFFINITAAIV